MKPNNHIVFLTALCCLMLGSCSLIPKYQRPGLPVTEKLQANPDTSAAAADTTIADLGWREYFTDPILQQLIAAALETNRDLRVSALNIAAYQAQYRIERSALFPSIDANAVATKQRTLYSSTYTTTEYYQVKAGLTAWELDFFGRLQSLEAKALEQYLAMEQTHRSAKINLVAEVAGAYLSWLTDRELLAISEDTRTIEEKSFNLIGQRVKIGIANELELAQARTSLEAVKANLARYRRMVSQDLSYLGLLTGTDISQIIAAADGSLGDQMIVADLPAYLPSSILLHRPDIMSAEHQLKGANADIGAARAAFFPAISITAYAGMISPDLGGLFDGNTGTWSFSPSITLPIFNAGRLSAQLDVAQIRKDISVANYEKAIQAAFHEAVDSLDAVSTYREQMAAQKANLEANREYHAKASQRYEQGLDSFLTLLDAQRSLYNARQNYLVLKQAQLVNQVTLYKVLGGGWKENK